MMIKVAKFEKALRLKQALKLKKRSGWKNGYTEKKGQADATPLLLLKKF